MKKLPSPPRPRSMPTKHRDKPHPSTSAPRRAGSNVTSSSYCPKTGCLSVTFHGGRTYRYEGIDTKMAADFRDSTSQGSFLHSHIIGKFTGSKIED